MEGTCTCVAFLCPNLLSICILPQSQVMKQSHHLKISNRLSPASWNCILLINHSWEWLTSHDLGVACPNMSLEVTLPLFGWLREICRISTWLAQIYCNLKRSELWDIIRNVQSSHYVSFLDVKCMFASKNAHFKMIIVMSCTGKFWNSSMFIKIVTYSEWITS